MESKRKNVAPLELTLQKNSVHVWKLVVSEHLGLVNDYLELLNSDERQKVEKFHFKKDKITGILSRGMLRKLLAIYTNIDSEKIVFSYNQYGKPKLDNIGSLHFNVSHAEDIILFAFTNKNEIGIDIEKIKTQPDSLNIASHFFSKAEVDELTKCPIEDRDTMFFNCWTRKEAFIKAVGEGLSYPLDSFTVSMEAQNQNGFVKLPLESDKEHSYSLFSFLPHNQYTAAIVISEEIKTINLYNVLDFI